MKFSIPAALILLALGVTASPVPDALPVPDPTKNGHPGKYKPDANEVFKFTSTWKIIGTPDQVVNGTTPTGGLPGSKGVYRYGIDSTSNTICYHITLYGFRGNYQSPALTATHIHQGAKGASGPPRIAFPNPAVTKDPNVRVSQGCITGPFKTGVIVMGADTGDGFDVKQIEQDPKNFFTDVHSSLAIPGANRGQFKC